MDLSRQGLVSGKHRTRKRPVRDALDDFETRVLLRVQQGGHVTTRSLAGEFGVGVDKMHLALQRLAVEGLVARHPRGALRATSRIVPL